MKKAKVLFVQGDVLHRGGKRVHTLAEDIEKAINEFTDSIDGTIDDISVNTDFANMLSGGGKAVVVIRYDGKAKEKPVVKAKGGK